MTGCLTIAEQWPAKGSPAWGLLHPSVARTRVATSVHDGAALRVLHVLSQQPEKTGSGVYLNALVREGAADGSVQRAIVGMPADAPLPLMPPLEEVSIVPVRFGTPSLPFPVAGMSDVMPYESTRFSRFTAGMLDAYLGEFFKALVATGGDFKPDIIHTHHLWLVTALCRVLFPGIPIVTTCHGTELRQLDLARGLAPFVLPACSMVDKVMVLHEDHARRVAARYGVDRGRITIIGAGYRDDIFCPPDAAICPPSKRDMLTVIYAGKISEAKGLPWLIEAMAQVDPPGGKTVRLLIAGAGGSQESERIREKACRAGSGIVFLGALSQAELAAVFRAADVFVLPSFYEGLPLVVLESVACCCRVVVTDLQGIECWLPDELVRKGIVERVALPRLRGPDRPEPADLPGFTKSLAAAISRQLSLCVCEEPDRREGVIGSLEPMKWRGISRKVREVYRSVLP